MNTTAANKRILHIVSLLLIFCLLGGGFSCRVDAQTSTSEEFKITVSSVEASAGDLVTLKVSVAGNPGLAYLGIPLIYDESALERVEITGTGLSGWIIGKKAIWVSPDNTYYSGDILKLTFRLNKELSDGQVLRVGVDDPEIWNTSEEAVPVQTVPGYIVVVGKGQSAADNPTAEDAIEKEPVREDPATEDTIGKEPVTEAPITEDPAAEDAIGKEPAAEDPITENPVAEDAIGKEPIADHPTADSATDDRTAENVPLDGDVTKPAADHPNADSISKQPGKKLGQTVLVSGQKYRITKIASGSSAGSLALLKAKNKKQVVVPASVRINGKTYRVTKVAKGAFAGSKIRTVTLGKNVKTVAAGSFKKSKAKTIVVKTSLLTKGRIKGCLKGAKVKKVKVRLGSKKKSQTYVKKYRKIFTTKNVGALVSVGN